MSTAHRKALSARNSALACAETTPNEGVDRAMKLTPLGKLLLFLVGLGIVLTAVHRVLPPELKTWDGLMAKLRGSSAPAAPAAPGSPGQTTPKAPSAPSSPSGGTWVRIP